MSEHHTQLTWERGDQVFETASFSRRHQIRFQGGQAVTGSAAPDFHGDADCVDPEQAFTASLSSCHMLTFLAVAARRGYIVDRYEDEAVGELGKDEQGRFAMVRVTLRPKVTFGGDKRPDQAALDGMHERAHRACFIGNSVICPIEVADRSEVAG